MNRSVPVSNVLPHVVYENVPAAIAWLSRTLGFALHYSHGSPVNGAQMHLGDAWIMLTTPRAGRTSAKQSGCWTQSLTIFVNDVEAHFENTKRAGAKIVEELHETIYGERQYGAEDLDGHLWLFSQHARDVDPVEWGATVEKVETRLQLLPRPRFCYLEIPVIELGQSVLFYEKVFGWNIRHRESARPSFADATGNISGAWVTDRDISRTAGLLPYIWVDSIDDTLAQVTAQAGEIVEAPHLDSPGGESMATFRDPAGNLIGLYQEGSR